MERQGDHNSYDTSGDGLASFCTCFYLIATVVYLSANQQSSLAISECPTYSHMYMGLYSRFHIIIGHVISAGEGDWPIKVRY